MHTRFDGNVVSAVSVCSLHDDVNALGTAAAAVAHAIVGGITQAPLEPRDKCPRVNNFLTIS